jgi:hypothetical protein
MASELCSKSIKDYSEKESSPCSQPPALIETEAKNMLTTIPLKQDPCTMQILLKLILNNWDRIMSTGQSLLENKYDELSGTSFERNWLKADKQANWSYAEKMVFTFKETLTPIFVNSTSSFVQKCIADILGPQYAPLLNIIFMSGAVQNLLTFIIKQIYAQLGGPGADKPLNWRAILIRLALFLLQLFLLLLANWAILTVLSEYTLIIFFLQKVTPRFITWAVNTISSMLLQ